MPEKEKCSKCVNEFECGSNDDSCWCSKIIISKENLNVISQEYDGCLCPSCLQEYQNSTETEEVPSN